MPRPSPCPSPPPRPWRRARVAAGLAALALLSACAPTLPPLQRPDPPPGRYPEADATPGLDAARRWDAVYLDPGFQRLVAQALAHNGDLRQAALRVAEARVALGLQQAEALPTLAASAAATRSGVPADLSLTRRPVVGNQFQVGIGFSGWEIDFWGRVAALEQAALQAHLASEAGARAAETALVAQLAQAWLALRETEARLALARRTLDSRAESLRIFRRRVELGATAPLELTQVELLWRQAQTLLAQLEQARATQLNALAPLVGQPVDWQPDPGWPDTTPWMAPLRAGLPSELLLRRPDIVAAEHALLASEAQLRAARAAFFPRIALTASAGSASAQLEGLFQAGSQAWSLAPLLSLPWLDGGRRQGGFELADVRRQQALERYAQAVQGAFRDVADALAAQRWLAEQTDTVRATLALQQQRARLAKLRYEAGAARYLEVLDAERDLLSTEQQLVQLRRAQRSAQVALYAALGGGTMEDTPR